MKVYIFKKTLLINTSLEEAWKFFSSPHNLAKITPNYMKFKVLNENKEEPIYEGMIIRYKVSPVLNIPLNWITEITHVEHQKRFIDEQRFGPYKFWHHEHHFISKENGVLMEDILHYAIGYSALGRVVNHFIVRKRLDEIFEFRKQVIIKIFNSHEVGERKDAGRRAV